MSSGERRNAKAPMMKLFDAYHRRWRKRYDYEFLPATLEVLERPPVPLARFMLLFIVLFFCSVACWSWWANIDIVVSAPGMVVPTGKVKIIQALDSGLVVDIHVRDGQRVKRGAVLITLDGTANYEDLQTIEKELAVKELLIRRLTAQMNDDPALFQPPVGADPQEISLCRGLLDQALMAQHERMASLVLEIDRCEAEREAVRADVRRLSEALPLATELYEKKQALAEQRLVAVTEVLQARIELTNARHSLDGTQSRLVEATARLDRAREEHDRVAAEYRRDLLDQLTNARNDRAQLQHQLAKTRSRQHHYELRSPVDGIVQQLAIHTVGGVVTAAQPLLVIVPVDNGFEVEAKVLNKDIGLVVANQPVSVKISAFPFTRYGDLGGRIEWVAGDAVVDPDLGPVYPIRISLAGYELPNRVNGRTGTIAPGMSVAADVKVGRRRVMDYFLGPILRYRDQSLREM